MARARVLNTYSVDDFRNVCAQTGYLDASVFQVKAAYGHIAGDSWRGGFLVKFTNGQLGHFFCSDDGYHLNFGQHELDFPELPEKVDTDPMIINEWLDEAYGPRTLSS